MATTVRVCNGHVEEWTNGARKRIFGSNIVAAATDGTLVAAVTASGHVEEWVNGARKRV